MARFRLVQDLTSGADCLLDSSSAVISCRGAAVVAAVGLQGNIATTAGVLILGAHSAAPICMINWADSITGFPILNTVWSTHVTSKLLCAEVRVDGGDAVIITEAPLTLATNMFTSSVVHFCAAPFSFVVPVVHTGDVGHTIEYKGEDAGTAGVRSRHSVAAGAGRLCADVSTKFEAIIMEASFITRLPLFNAVFSTHVES